MYVTVTFRRLLPVLGTLAAGVAISACASSKATTTTKAASTSTTSATSSTFGKRRAALITCLRQHGVTLPNRPRASTTPPPGGFGRGGGLFRQAASNPKLRAAFQACGGNLRFRGRPGAFRFSHARIESFVACVRTHGYPQMPAPNFSGKGPVFPPSIRSNPKFQSASRLCQSVLVPSAPPGAAGTTASS